MTAVLRCLDCGSTATIGTPDGSYCGACDAKVFVYLDLSG